MLTKFFIRVVLIALSIAMQSAQAEVKEYVRDYNYRGEIYDTAASCRTNAIDGVKRELLEELGTYVGSVAKIHQDSLGNSYMSQDVINITAGIVALKVLHEQWKQPVYYVKAGMKADPDDVLSKLKAMRADLELEKNLRESYEELERARKEMAELKAQLAQLKLAAAIPVKPVETVIPVVVPEKSIPAPSVVAPVKPVETPAKNARPEPEVVAIVEPTPTPTPVVESAPDVKKLMENYQRVVETIDVEEAFQRALVAQMKGDVGASLREISALAEKGYAAAQLRMGWMYMRGIGVKHDPKKAREWFEKARANGSADALAYIGSQYEFGKKDFETAREYYQRAINEGSALGYVRMGWLFQTGKTKEFDRVKAVEYYEKAIAMGSYEAMERLGLLYQLGQGGLPRDEEKAVQLYQQAVDHGVSQAMARLGHMYNLGQGGLAKDYEKGLALLRESARLNDIAGYAFLGYAYENGWGVPQDYAEAKKWYDWAADKDAPFAMFRLGALYKDGLGVKRDITQARYWLKRAVENNHEGARRMLDHMDRFGR